MKWGLERAYKLGLESYIEATEEGKPCYETFGFQVIDRNEFQPKEGTVDEEWKEVESQLLPFTWWSMLRSAKA